MYVTKKTIFTGLGENKNNLRRWKRKRKLWKETRLLFVRWSEERMAAQKLPSLLTKERKRRTTKTKQCFSLSTINFASIFSWSKRRRRGKPLILLDSRNATQGPHSQLRGWHPTNEPTINKAKWKNPKL